MCEDRLAMFTGYGADGEDPGEQARDVVGDRGFMKKKPGTIKYIAPYFGRGVLTQLSVPLCS